MIVKCTFCKIFYEDKFRLTYCPHQTFLANDGKNNYEYHENAYLSEKAPPPEIK